MINSYRSHCTLKFATCSKNLISVLERSRTTSRTGHAGYRSRALGSFAFGPFGHVDLLGPLPPASLLLCRSLISRGSITARFFSLSGSTLTPNPILGPEEAEQETFIGA